MEDFIVDDEDDGYDSVTNSGSDDSGSESDGSSSRGVFNSKAAQSRAAVAASLDDAGERLQHCAPSALLCCLAEHLLRDAAELHGSGAWRPAPRHLPPRLACCCAVFGQAVR
jgi:hypothetical protein